MSDGLYTEFIRVKPIRIGRTRLYTLGPIALFITPKPTNSGSES